jgi:hypothetical protein
MAGWCPEVVHALAYISPNATSGLHSMVDSCHHRMIIIIIIIIKLPN